MTADTLSREALMEALHENGQPLYYALGGETTVAALAAFVAAFAAEGWSGDAGRDAIGYAVDGYDPEAMVHAARAAADIGSPWSSWAHCSDPKGDLAAHAEVLRRLLRQHRPATAVTASLESAVLPWGGTNAPDWLVPGTVVRGRVHVLHGPQHAAKTTLRDAMLAASLTGVPFLGREVRPLRWMIVDGENYDRDVLTRWAALGITEDLVAEYVHLTARGSKLTNLADAEVRERTERVAESFAPDVIVVDTIARCFRGLDANSQDAVAAVFDNLLAPLADDHGAAVLASGHDGKRGGRGAGAMLGSVQWGGQADQTMQVAFAPGFKEGKIERTPRPDGLTDTRTAFVLTREKGRVTWDQTPEAFAVVGVTEGPPGAEVLHELRVVPGDGKPATPTTAAKAHPLDGEIVAALADGPLARSDLAVAVGKRDDTGRAFRDALKRVIAAGQVVQSDDGCALA